MGDNSRGAVLGGYALGERIGAGAMGRVFRATGPDGATVAVKVLHGNLACVEEYTRRFQREAKLAEKLAHPNVVRVLGSGEDDGQHWIAMEYVEGETLTQRLERAGIRAPTAKSSGSRAGATSPPRKAKTDAGLGEDGRLVAPALLYTNGLTFSELRAHLEGMSARMQLVVLDACHDLSGSLIKGRASTGTCRRLWSSCTRAAALRGELRRFAGGAPLPNGQGVGGQTA